jgi:hypothetical protein
MGATNDEIATAACGVLAKTGTNDEIATAAFGVLAKTGGPQADEVNP